MQEKTIPGSNAIIVSIWYAQIEIANIFLKTMKLYILEFGRNGYPVNLFNLGDKLQYSTFSIYVKIFPT